MAAWINPDTGADKTHGNRPCPFVLRSPKLVNFVAANAGVRILALGLEETFPTISLCCCLSRGLAVSAEALNAREAFPFSANVA